MKSEKVRYRVFVKGRVQGVGYRFFTVNLASKLGVNGWVRNLPSGDVEAVLEGEKEDVQRMLNAMRKGPAFSYVSELLFNEEPVREGEFNSFSIIY